VCEHIYIYIYIYIYICECVSVCAGLCAHQALFFAHPQLAEWVASTSNATASTLTLHASVAVGEPTTEVVMVDMFRLSLYMQFETGCACVQR
jgi:hypothetical protein